VWLDEQKNGANETAPKATWGYEVTQS
jgi:hypothetical protein